MTFFILRCVEIAALTKNQQAYCREWRFWAFRDYKMSFALSKTTSPITSSLLLITSKRLLHIQYIFHLSGFSFKSCTSLFNVLTA